MPISQSRVIALINCALDYKQALERLITQVQQAHERNKLGIGDATYHFDNLVQNADPSILLQQHALSLSTLSIEYHHFRRNTRKNERAAQKSQAKRRLFGAIPRSTTPRTETLAGASMLPAASALLKPNYQMGNLAAEDKLKILEQLNAEDDNPPTEAHDLEDSILEHPADQAIDEFFKDPSPTKQSK